MSEGAVSKIDPAALIRSKEYRRLLVIAAFISSGVTGPDVAGFGLA